MQTLQIAAEFAAEMEDIDSSMTDRVDTAEYRSLPRRWSARVLDSTVCCACLLILSPAIVAVWIAIRRSGYTGRASTKITANFEDSHLSIAPSKNADPLMIVLKPERMRSGAFIDSTPIRATPSNAAHAAV